MVHKDELDIIECLLNSKKIIYSFIFVFHHVEERTLTVKKKNVEERTNVSLHYNLEVQQSLVLPFQSGRKVNRKA